MRLGSPLRGDTQGPGGSPILCLRVGFKAPPALPPGTISPSSSCEVPLRFRASDRFGASDRLPSSGDDPIWRGNPNERRVLPGPPFRPERTVSEHMADDDLNSNDLNPSDRGALKRAADDLLKTARREDRARARQERAEADSATEPSVAEGDRDEWDELLDRVSAGATGGEDAASLDSSSFDAGSDAVAAARERLAAIEKEAEEAREQSLRMAADMENLRRRTQREVQDAKSFSVSNFARDMLDVADNLSRALDAVPEGSDDPALIGLKEGVEMTARALDRTLEKHGVRRLDPEGEKFDPNFHQAMFKVPNPDVPAGSVVQVVQAGYAIGPRVLRPAMVGVAEGGPKFADPSSESDQAA